MQTFELFSFLLLVGASKGLHLPKIFKDEMVLQAGSKDHPVRTIWGFLDGVSSTVELTGLCDLPNGTSIDYSDTFVPKENLTSTYEFWFYTEFESGTECDFIIIQEGMDEDISLFEVLFGDVWICSGQSNMGWTMDQIFDSDQELDRLANDFPKFRLMKIKQMTSDTPQDDLMEEDFDMWAGTAKRDYAKRFSAVCLLTASYMAEILGKDKPFGLIHTAWGGTRIEPWFYNQQECNIDDNVDEDNPANSNKYLYNAMIHPLVRSGIKGAMWYQGESNIGWNRDKYQCAIKQLISDWKTDFQHYRALADPDRMPFGFVQLSTINQDKNPGTPVIRWHQTADYGYVPNEILPDSFMAVSLDTYDEESGIHPRNKQLPSKRLASAGLNVAYGLKEWPTNGPFPGGITYSKIDNDLIQVHVLLNQDFTWNDTETNGFSYCNAVDFAYCNAEAAQWIKVEKVNLNGRVISMSVPADTVGVAYLWETTPVLQMEGLPIYAADQYRLPAAPWIRQIEFSASTTENPSTNSASTTEYLSTSYASTTENPSTTSGVASLWKITIAPIILMTFLLEF